MLTSLRCLGAGRRGTTAVIISRPCWCRPASGGTPRNLSETVPVSAKAMQRFLTESPWDDDTVIGRLQEYLGPRLEDPEAVWVVDGSDFPKHG